MQQGLRRQFQRWGLNDGPFSALQRAVLKQQNLQRCRPVFYAENYNAAQFRQRASGREGYRIPVNSLFSARLSVFQNRQRAVSLSLHRQTAAAVGILADIQIGSHQHEPASTGPLDKLFQSRVRNFFGNKTFALVLDDDSHLHVVDLTDHGDQLVRIQLIAMANGVRDALFQRQPHREHIAHAVLKGLHQGNKLLLNGQTFRRVAWETNFKMDGFWHSRTKDSSLWILHGTNVPRETDRTVSSSELAERVIKVCAQSQHFVQLSNLEDVQNVLLNAAQNQLALGRRRLLVHRDQLAKSRT